MKSTNLESRKAQLNAAHASVACTSMTITSALAAVLLWSTASPAQATEVTRSVRVPHADLNLGTIDGRAALDARIHRTARNVCNSPSALMDVRAMMGVRRCVEGAVDSAAPQAAALVERQTRQQLAGRAQSLPKGL